MGFRSTFTTEDFGTHWPQWFKEKYDGMIWFPESGGPIHSIREAKAYTTWSELPDDIQKAIDWGNLVAEKFILVFLHECGGVTRCQIEKDDIKWSEPSSWRQTQGIEHDYCYGCSDFKDIQQ